MWSSICLCLQQWDSLVVSLQPESDFLDLPWCKCIFNFGTCLKASPLYSGSVTPLLHSQPVLNCVVRPVNGRKGWTGICGLFKLSVERDWLQIGEANTFRGFDCSAQLLFEQLFSGKCWKVFTTSSHCKGTIVCSWMGQIQPRLRRSFYLSMPSPVLTLIPQVVACLRFDPGQLCLR